MFVDNSPMRPRETESPRTFAQFREWLYVAAGGHLNRKSGTVGAKLPMVTATENLMTVGLTTREKASGQENHCEAYGTENGDDEIQNQPYFKTASLRHSADHEKRNGQTEQDNEIHTKL